MNMYKPVGIKLLISLLIIFFTTCTTAPNTTANNGPNTPANNSPDPLDTAIRATSDYLNNRLKKGIKLVFLNLQSESPSLSEYIIDGLIENTVNDNLFTVVDRQNIALIQKEINFQLSGEVSDESAQKIGKLLGAQVIVSGAISPLGNLYRLRIRAISVETAEIQGQINRDIASSPRIMALHGNSGASFAQSSYPTGNSGSTQSVTAGTQTTQTPTPTASGTTPVAPAAPSVATPPQSGISTDRAGLYVNGAYQGQMDLLDSIDWIKLNAKSGGNYVIVLGKDEAVPYIMLNFNNLQLSITLKASGAERRVRYDNNRPSYPVFTVGAGVTFILEDGITLTGLQSNSKSMVNVEGGNFTMNGGSIKDNKNSNSGGGVSIESGDFTMNNGVISGNTGRFGGGVYINRGTFTMNNGTISGNTGLVGGGVYVNKGSFTMTNGIISGNSSGESGGGVYCFLSGIFTKLGTGGIIYGSNAPDGQANKASRDSLGHAVYISTAANNYKRNSTARVSQALDSKKRGADGGWE